ncbi:Yip1 family protein [Roseovarius tibetensis]|uniref:Yip1 family protein n=1 Tax=Roseovarius tibetensis TaxID=2685897 RepID=UPI003D7FB36E
MTRDDVLDLLRQTLFQPREAARLLIDMRLPSQWLWLALVLMAILNSIFYTLSVQINPPTDPSAALMPPVFQAPILFAVLLFGALALTVIALSFVGQGLGGAAEMTDILVLLTWLQVLRLLVQAGVLVLALGAPALAAIAVIVSAVWGVYILIGFVDAAHRFDNRFKAAGVIVLSFVAMAIGLSTLLSLVGIFTMRGG